jgi:hypothetical protein
VGWISIPYIYSIVLQGSGKEYYTNYLEGELEGRRGGSCGLTGWTEITFHGEFNNWNKPIEHDKAEINRIKKGRKVSMAKTGSL